MLFREFKSLLPLRQSVRAYTDEPVTEAQIDALLAAAQSAPVCMGRVETVKFSVVTDPAAIAEASEAGDAERLEELRAQFEALVAEYEALTAEETP